MSDQVVVSLRANQEELWRRFHSEVNEMIVTKAGRNFFPKLEYLISGLNPYKFYAMMIQIELVDDYRYKFINGEWLQSGKADDHTEAKKAWHVDGVRTGKDWMDTTVCFENVKITNDLKASKAWMIPLHSMHKYIPVLQIYEAPSEHPFLATSSNHAVVSVRIPYTEFVAVTAYQNQKVIDLKIEFNAYAKGFRKEKQDGRKRRSSSVNDYSTDEYNSKSSSPQPKCSRANSSSPPDLSFPFPSVSPPITPLFSFPNFSSSTPFGNIPSFPFAYNLFLQSFNPIFAPLLSATIKEEPKESEEEIDIIH